MVNTAKLVVPLTGALSAAVVLVGILVAYYKQKDDLENAIAEISKGMGEMRAAYDVRISRLESAKNTDLENRLAKVEEATSSEQIMDWNRWRGELDVKLNALESWRLQTDRLFEINRDSLQRLWRKVHQHHGVE